MEQSRFLELKDEMHLIREKDMKLSAKVDSKAINDESELKYADNSPTYKQLNAADLPIYRKWICGEMQSYYRGRVVNGRVVCDKITIDTNDCSYNTLSLSSVMAGDHTECNETEFNNAICKLITYLEK